MTGYGQPKIKVPAFIITTVVAVIIPNESDQTWIQFPLKRAVKGCSIVSEAEKEAKESLYVAT